MAITFESTSRTLAAGEGKIHYHEAGAGAPLLLLHGSGPGVNGWLNFGGNLPTFAARFRCLVPDLPGYGRSDPVTGLPIPAAVAAVLRFCDLLTLPRVHIIGNSYGAIIGARFAAQCPDRVDRLIAIGGIGFNIFSTFPGEGLSRLVDFIEDPTRANIAAWLRSMVFDPGLVTDGLIDERFAAAMEPVTMATSRRIYTREALGGIAAMRRGPNATEDFAYLPKILAPTLLAVGRDDRVNPLDCALLPMRLIPRCELHVFPNCGHWAMIERREEFQSVALEFLSRA
ncbi:MAG: alpha/beta fold hydrolase [Proteobacteria bacterium]|nr:alpha/beta fold hydrolase [Pseudomonadota bacterium]